MALVTKTVYSEPGYDYRQWAIHVRGTIITEVAKMERMIDDYIAKHFCHYRKRQIELIEVIISTKHLTFQSKADIVRFIVVRRGDATKEQATKIHNALLQENKIAYHRNLLAHAELDTSREAVNIFKADKQTVRFIKFSANSTKPVVYDKKEVIRLLELIQAVIFFFNDVKHNEYQKRLKGQRHTPLSPYASTKRKKTT